MHFEDLRLIEPLLRAVKAEGYTTPTPIQERAIPPALEGKDILGCAQTGTGKTAAFALPILQRLSASKPAGQHRPIRCLILTPTRELATQIGDSFGAYGKHTGMAHTVIFGGVGQDSQDRALRRGVDIVVATPGRLLDMMNQGLVPLGRLEVFVLDEADRMLDMGFIHDVRRVITALPKKRQTLFFSATMPPVIQELASTILTDPTYVEVTPVASTAETIDQKIFFVEKSEKRSLLVHVLRDPKITKALVFSRTKHGANRITEHLQDAGVRAEVIHGNKSQNARERALAAFKGNGARVLVATDIAARGIDVDGVSHVINFDLPNVPEDYVHRIGRTGRAGASGIALSFCDTEEREFLRDIERLTKRHVPVIPEHPHRSPTPPPGLTNLESRLGSGGSSAPARRNGSPSRNSGGHGAGGHGGRSFGGRGGGGGGGGGGGRPQVQHSGPRTAAPTANNSGTASPGPSNGNTGSAPGGGGGYNGGGGERSGRRRRFGTSPR